MAERTQPVSAPTPRASSEPTPASTARLTLSADEFALASLFERIPDVRVECESTVANPDDHALLAVQTDNLEQAVDAAFRSDPTVAAVECFGERCDEQIYRVTWEGHPRQLIRQLVAADATILSAQGQGGEWKLRLLTPDRDGISRANEIMTDLGCKPEYRRISAFDDKSPTDTGLTDEQHETLLTAFEMGYYNIPRDVTAAELASELGISHQALSERFRRAHRELIKSASLNT